MGSCALWKKAATVTHRLFLNRFNTSKCKRAAKLVVFRIEELQDEKLVAVRRKKQEIALLLKSGKDATARSEVEIVVKEENIMDAYDIIQHYCQIIVRKLPIIAKNRECPANLKACILTLIFAAAKCSVEIPELVELSDIFEKKYGKDFVGAATGPQPNCRYLLVTTPAGEEVKLKVLKEIANKYQIEWDTTKSETELPKPAVDGPQTFVSASSMRDKPTAEQFVQPNNPPSHRYSGNSQHVRSVAEAAAAEYKMPRK